MATIKSYTDLEQSMKLAEILPFESADMYWMNGKINNVKLLTPNIIGNNYDEPLWNDWDVPCWSLAALLGVLPSATLDSSNDHYYRLHCVERYTEWYDNPVDACYEMIIKLNELKML